MTLTADSKKRVVIPGAAPGDVFACEQTNNTVVLRRVYRGGARRKRTKAEVLRAIRTSKFKPAISWEELRKLTREV
jgi:hypothetical protein